LIFEKCLEKVDGFAKLLPIFPQGFNIKTIDPVLSGMKIILIDEIKKDIFKVK
jgi:hypothetical protein